MKRSFLFLILVLWSVSYSSAQQVRTPNIAIIADKAGGLGQSPLISLLEVQLSKNDNIRLLERAQIDKILQEQQLSASGLLDRTNTIKIGQLLRADAFIIITLEGELIRVRVAETAHGLRLLDCFEELDNTKLDEISKKIAGDIKNISGKFSLPAGQLIPVGIVDIHRVQLGEQHRILERTLPVLLSVRLGLEPKIIMLEREDLKILQNEKLRTQGEDSKFWASAVLIEGTLQPKDGGLIMSLTLHRPDGEKAKSFTVPVDPNEPLAAIDKSAANIVQEILNAPPSTQWQLAAEAEQYYQQGKLLANHQRNRDAIKPLETACTLQSHIINYIGTLFEQVWLDHQRYVQDLRDSQNKGGRSPSTGKLIVELVLPQYSDLEIAELVSVFIHQLHDQFEKGRLSLNNINLYWSMYLGTGSGPTSAAYFLNSMSATTGQIRLINAESRKVWIETMENLQRKRLLEEPDQQMNIASSIAQLAWLSSDDPEILLDNIKKAFSELVMPPVLGGKIQSDWMRGTICNKLFNLQGGPPVAMSDASPSIIETTQLKGSSEKFISLWKKYINELADVNDPVLSTTSKLVLARISSFSSNQSKKAQTLNTGYEAIQNLLDKLKNYDASKGNQAKRQLITQIKSSILSLIDNKTFSQEIEFLEQMCTTLIEQDDITNLVFLNPGKSLFANFPRELFEFNAMNRYYLLLDRVGDVLQAHKNESQMNAALTQIKDTQARIRKYFPEFEVSKTTSNLKVTMLLTQKDWFKNPLTAERNLQIKQRVELTDGLLMSLIDEIQWSERSYQVKMQDKIIWVAFSSVGYTAQDSQRRSRTFVDIGLVGINLIEKKQKALWQGCIFPANSGILNITDFVVNNTTSYLSLNNIGILEFPGFLKEGRGLLDNPKLYTKENGLPSILITSLAQDGRKLWVAYGDTGQESGLGLYEPKNEKWETIFCSTLKGESPFSQGQSYLIKSMLLESPDKLLFSARGNNFTQAGLWKLNTDTKQLQYIWSGVTDIYKDFNNNIWLNSTGYKMMFDPDLNKITVIMQPGRKQWYASVIKNLSGLSRDLFVPESFLNAVTFGPYSALGNLDLSPSTIHKNKLWARLGTSQIIVAEKGKSFEEAQIIDNNLLDGQPVERFVSTPYGLIAIGQGAVGLIETE
jgi:hypothetical protein